MRYACGLLLTLACACGGGSGGGVVPTNGTSPLQDAAQQVLEGCGSGALGDFLELLEIFEGLLDPDETSPTQFMIVGVDAVAASVDWGLDLDGDQQPDVVGSIRFTDEAGEAEPAALVDLLLGGLDDLDAMIASLPDGTQVTFAAGNPEPPPFDLTITFTVFGGVLDSVSGIVVLQDAECQANFDFADESFEDVGGDYPTLTLNVILATLDGAIEGTIVFDGTNQARAEVTLGVDPEVFAFLINLDTGAVTPTQ